MAGGGLGATLVLGLALLGTGTSSDIPMPADESSVGHLQIKAEPGVAIVVDAEPRGEVEESHGLLVKNLGTGTHELTLYREGFRPQTARIRIAAHAVTVHHVAPWRPVAEPGTDSNEAGALIVQTLPVDATVSARSLGYPKLVKGDAPLVLPHVPAGRHKLTFCTEYKCIDYRTEIAPGAIVNLLVDFDPGEVLDLSHHYRDHLARLSRACGEDAESAACRQACEVAERLGRGLSACQQRTPAGDLARGRGHTIPASAVRTLP